MGTKGNTKDLHGSEATTVPPTAICFRSSMDRPLRPNGLLRLPRLHHRHAPHVLHGLPPPHQARCHPLHHPTGPQSRLDAPLFVAKRPVEALVDIVALTGTVGYLTYVWGQVDAVAGWALAPYLGWLGFATYLTAGVGHLNNWNLADKEVPASPEGKGTKYVDEKKEL